jgi:hypothetical protein
MDLFIEIAKKIPDVEQLLPLEPEELAGRLLLLWQSYSPHEYIQPSSFDPGQRLNSSDLPYPADRWPEIAHGSHEEAFGTAGNGSPANNL